MSTQLVRRANDRALPTLVPRGCVGIDSPTTGPAHEKQVGEIVERLQRRYPRPQISIADLDRLVRGCYRQFEAARVHTFVAILVERLVRHSIEAPSQRPRVLAT
jgi:hypothetical protein